MWLITRHMMFPGLPLLTMRTFQHTQECLLKIDWSALLHEKRAAKCFNFFSLIMSFLVSTIRLLMAFEGAKDCTEAKFQQQLQYVIDGQPRAFLAIYHEPCAGDVTTFAWPDSETYRVRPLADPKSKIMCTYHSFFSSHHC